MAAIVKPIIVGRRIEYPSDLIAHKRNNRLRSAVMLGYMSRAS